MIIRIDTIKAKAQKLIDRLLEDCPVLAARHLALDRSAVHATKLTRLNRRELLKRVCARGAEYELPAHSTYYLVSSQADDVSVVAEADLLFRSVMELESFFSEEGIRLHVVLLSEGEDY